MRLKDLIRAPKHKIRFVGPWSNGNIPRSQFPLLGAPSRGYKFGPTYEWRIASFEVESLECRVLVLLNEGRQRYRAALAIARGKEFMPVCDHEFHTTAEPWHCHAVLEEFQKVPQGVRRRFMTKWPRAGSVVDKAFVSSKQDAISRAFKVFRVDEPGELL
jgi:hypothetical protein